MSVLARSQSNNRNSCGNPRRNTHRPHGPFPAHRYWLWLAILAALLLLPGSQLYAQSGEDGAAGTPTSPGERAENPLIANPEGGPVVLTGEVSYTNPFFTLGIASPLIVLEDQAGFIDRNPGFVLPTASQTLGQITSDFLESPFTYSLALPIEPQGTLRDVDQDSTPDRGVMVFAVAYWTNKFGDPFLEERDLFGGGWSTAYASTRVSNLAASRNEVVGGKLLVYAPDDQQGFPMGFGPDERLFTQDDPTMPIPQGYTLVDLDTTPFTFDRSRRPVVDLIEPDFAALDDFSDLDYLAAFDALIDLLERKYAFTDYKDIDWGALAAEFRPRIASAQERDSRRDYLAALRDFSFAIPDGHIQGPVLAGETRRRTQGGLGLALRRLDDERIVAAYLTPDGPAQNAGIAQGDTIIAINEEPIDEYVAQVVAWNGPFSTDHVRRRQQIRYATRFPVGASVQVAYQPADAQPEEAAAQETTTVETTTVTTTVTTTLTATAERESFRHGFTVGATGFEPPLEYRLLDEGFAYVRIYSFLDNDVLTVQLWERLLRTLNEQGAPGLIIDLRQNGGGNGFLADQMAAYFFNESLELGNTGRYDPELDDFYFDPRTVEQFYLPSEELRYHGPIAVLVGPSCSSACEFFAYDLTLEDRAVIVGQAPTAGLGGSIAQVRLPDGAMFQYPNGRAVDMNGEIHIEGKGVAPDIRVPVTEETLFGPDAGMDAAIEALSGPNAR